MMFQFLKHPAAALVLFWLGGVCDSAHGQIKATLKGHKDTITCVVFAPDGKTLASGAKDGKVILWDVATAAAKTSIPGPEDMVTALAWAPDGKTPGCGDSSHAATRANSRYLKAVKTLATVRKLALPVLQISLARNQINVAPSSEGMLQPLQG